MNEARDLQQHVALLEQKRTAGLWAHLSRFGKLDKYICTYPTYIYLYVALIKVAHCQMVFLMYS
jgi:hypothetical protein